MKSPRTVALVTAGLVLAALAVVTIWPRGDEIAEWSAGDLERAPREVEGDPAEVSVQRDEIDSEAMARTPADDAAVDAARTLTLRGRVVDPHGAGVAGASVQLELRGAERERVRKPVTTGADGRFAFRGPLRGVRTVTVLAMHRDFAPILVDRDVPPAAERDEFQLGDISLGRGARVRGFVVDADGTALAGAAVELSPESSNRVSWSGEAKKQLAVPTTDGAGAFEFDHVPPGAYRAIARATRMVAASSESFAVADDGTTTLPPITLLAGTLLHGLVTDRRGRGVEKASINVTPAGIAGPQQRAVTGADGRFTLDHLRPRLSELRVFAPGFVAHRERIDLARQSELTVALDDGLRIAGQVCDAATGQPVEAFAVQARRLRSLREPVPAAFAGRPRDELTQQLAAASRAQLDKPDDVELVLRMADIQRALTALDAGGLAPESREPGLPQDPGAIGAHPQGAFELTGLDEGVYAVDVKADDYLLARSTSFELRRGASVDGLTIALGRGLTVRGQVVRATDGTGIGKARIELMSLQRQIAALQRGPNERRPRGPTIASAITGDDGTFVLRNVRPGRCAALASARGFDTTTGEPFDLQADTAGLRVELAARATLHGRVLGVPEGRTAEVTVVAFATFRNVTSRGIAEDATFRIEELQPGGYHVRAYLAESRTAMRRLSVELQGQAPPAPTVTLQPGETCALDLPLTPVPVGALRGTVRVNGAAAGGYQVQLAGETANSPGRHNWSETTRLQQVEPDGSFAFNAVEAGSYQLLVLSIARDRVELARQPVQITVGEERRVTVDVGTASLEGEVVAPEDGKPLDGMLRLRPRGARPDDAASERPQDGRTIVIRVRAGRFRADVLPVGAFTLDFTVQNRLPVQRDVELAPGEQEKVTLTAGALKADGK